MTVCQFPLRLAEGGVSQSDEVDRCRSVFGRASKTTGGLRYRPPVGASDASRMAILEAFVCLAPTLEADVPIAA